MSQAFQRRILCRMIGRAFIAWAVDRAAGGPIRFRTSLVVEDQAVAPYTLRGVLPGAGPRVEIERTRTQ